LFERDSGVLTPTDSGQIVISHAERIELDVDAVKDSVTSADSIAVGKERVTAVPLVLNHILIPALPALLRAHKRLQIELAVDPRNLSVTNREADIALRMTRPDTEYRAVARRVGMFEYAVYAASPARGDLPWITYDRLDDVREDRDRWRAQAERLALGPPNATPSATPKRPWRRRLAG
jgi:DNA-binding transcriptional LysR family regulator